jgi:hypothetical protein
VICCMKTIVYVLISGNGSGKCFLIVWASMWNCSFACFLLVDWMMTSVTCTCAFDFPVIFVLLLKEIWLSLKHFLLSNWMEQILPFKENTTSIESMFVLLLVTLFSIICILLTFNRKRETSLMSVEVVIANERLSKSSYLGLFILLSMCLLNHQIGNSVYNWCYALLIVICGFPHLIFYSSYNLLTLLFLSISVKF